MLDYEPFVLQTYRLSGKERYSRVRSPVNSPRHFEDNLPVLLGTLQMQWQRQAKTLTPVLSDSTNCFKYYHTEVEYGVKKRKHCTVAEQWKTLSPIWTVLALIMMILAMTQTITITTK